jgi:UDP-glucuronate 4-epimerase
MALFKFVDAIRAGRPIEVYGEGNMSRDFTYIDDLIEGMTRLIALPPAEANRVPAIDSLSAAAPYRVVNVGRGEPTALSDLIAAVEAALGQTAAKTMLPMQPGDVRRTHASAELLAALTGYTPSTTIADGVRKFVEWYRGYSAAP